MEHLCILSEETFRTCNELEVHKSYHHGKKQFSCSHCGRPEDTHYDSHLGEGVWLFAVHYAELGAFIL